MTLLSPKIRFGHSGPGIPILDLDLQARTSGGGRVTEFPVIEKHLTTFQTRGEAVVDEINQRKNGQDGEDCNFLSFCVSFFCNGCNRHGRFFFSITSSILTYSDQQKIQNICYLVARQQESETESETPAAPAAAEAPVAAASAGSSVKTPLDASVGGVGVQGGGPEKTAETAVPSPPTENVAIESKKPEETKESDSRSADPDSCLFFELECFLPVSFKNILVDWPNFLDGIFYCTAQVMLLPMKLIAGSRLWSL